MEDKSLVYDGIDKEGLAFSKGIVLCSLIFYFIIVFVTLYMISDVIEIQRSAETATLTYLGTSLSWASGALAACITSSVALPVTAVVWYLKKTHLSYATKVQGDVGERMARVELGYNHGLLELKKNYSLSDDETDRMASTSQIKRLKDNLFTDVTSTAKTGVSEGASTIKKEV